MVWKSLLSVVLPATLLVAAAPVFPGAGQPAASSYMVDNFESYRVDGLPSKWKYIDSRQKVLPVTPAIMSAEEYFIIAQEKGNKFLRAVTKDRAHRLVLMNEDLGGWDLKRHAHLRWEWRANRLPKGAREDSEKLNDTGAAVYVTFSRDWLGRPRSIKYSYSSTLAVGTVVDYGRLQVIVVASGKDGIGRWKTVERNVREDYRKVFGEEPPDAPVSLMLWSDSNSVHDVAEVDFDNIALAQKSDVAGS